ncbi:MAG: T9SS type A sorting domain-containing protein [Chitinophagaceae bacterium]|jgi:dienelactone hydrolase
MKSFFYLTILVAFNSLSAFGQTYTGPIPKPTSGYGTDGSYTVATQSFANPYFPGHDIVIYYPAGITSRVPTLFYSHAFGGNNPNNISGFLNFVAKKGYAVVFVPYQTTGVTVEDRYSNLLNGFIRAAQDYPGIIDTTKVGFVGHSFGGGASFANAYHCFTTLNWGRSGRFIFAMAQWYSYNISQTELQSFPGDVKLLTLVYEDDLTNDQRMANDIFNTISIPASEKDYLRVKSDTVSGYVYTADHVVPNNSAFDALDYYAYYRLLDAMCDYAFNGSMAGKDVALGNGSVNQISMPGSLHNLIHSEAPTFANAQSTYQYPCSSADNPRSGHCDEVLSTSKIAGNIRFSMFPNPAQTMLYIETDKAIAQIDILNQQGQVVITTNTKNIPISELSGGLYFVKVSFTDNSLRAGKLIKE